VKLGCAKTGMRAGGLQKGRARLFTNLGTIYVNIEPLDRMKNCCPSIRGLEMKKIGVTRSPFHPNAFETNGVNGRPQVY